MLLFDQNISYRIISKINAMGLISKHVSEVNLQNKSDEEIWGFAKSNGYTIVTYDSDFIDFSVIKGFPLRIILIKSGNLSKDGLVRLLKNNLDEINTFLLQKNIGALEIYLND